MDLVWVLVPGGVCRYGDEGRPRDIPPLRWTATVLTADQLGVPGEAELPLTRICHQEATELAAQVGGRLPRSVEWEWMAAGPARRRYPWGDQPWRPELANLRDSGIGGATPVASYAQGATADGLYDVAGNVWEWTSTPVMGGGYVIRGGSFASPPLYAQCTFLNAAPGELRSRGIGVRAVRDL
ncbi:iron(II)-dependent oxidoreductase [Thermomonospora echinospora]|uniref:Iron(II)-dependent oxidoreductase n=1 Tax=Thermomonospora echinospora TaxID=1992 RepID=A0A1H6EAB3_9ACTN|nr:SUMF1/EgtB/PvdO family nonheme iron enzyme [Thermomonospora echinospora]SEG93856.1 iron(II)-dependent oxidoreductase [Thermomonospora echinospora]